MPKVYTRAELLEARGAQSDELEDFEARGLLVPNRSWSLLSGRVSWYTADQVEVLRWLVKTRRASQASTRITTRPYGSAAQRDGAVALGASVPRRRDRLDQRCDHG